jgi:hypothetical protein
METTKEFSVQTIALFHKANAHLKRWWVLGRDGNTQVHKLTEERPSDANQIYEGDSFTPWYAHYSHIHKEDGGIHFLGTLAEAREALQAHHAGVQLLPVR